MKIKIGYDDWHVECEIDTIQDLEKYAARAWAAYFNEFGIGKKNPMKLATYNGAEWWAVPPDHWTARNITGDITVKWPIDSNDFNEIFRRVEQSYQYGMGMRGLTSFVSGESREDKRAKFRIVKR